MGSFRDAVSTYRGHRVPRFRLIEHKSWWFALSGTVIVLSLAGLFLRGLNLSIDFEGGALLTYPDQAGVSADAVKQTMADFGRSDAEVQLVGGNQIQVRTASLNTLSDKERTDLKDALAAQAKVSVNSINSQDVGPTWGAQISRKALFGLIVVLVAITLYITMRFEWKMAIGAQLAMVHDVVITAGIYALVGREVTPATVIAVLTILGFSLYDTVVIYDKVKENTESPAMLSKDTYSGVVNTSLNQVLMRSVNTSLVVLLPVLSLLLFGGSTLKDFAFAMFIGVTTGAYSSIFVASPILAVLKEREKRYRQLRSRLEARTQTGRAQLQTVPVAATAAEARVSNAAASRSTARTGGGSSRPKPKSKKKPPAKRKRR
jgi:preprotein translocase subunit SecF